MFGSHQIKGIFFCVSLIAAPQVDWHIMYSREHLSGCVSLG